jgi:hypothetical protein
MNRKFVVAALTLMSAPVWAQTSVGTGGIPVRGSRTPIDTIRMMLLRRNPTIDEVLSWSSTFKQLELDLRSTRERLVKEKEAGADERVLRELSEVASARLAEMLGYQRVLLEGCAAIRPHEGESEGVMGFQIEKATTFERRTPVIKEERFARAPEIVFVEPNTPAAKAGIREGDKWLGIAGRELINSYVRDLNDVLKPDNRVDLRLSRDGREMKVEVVARKRRDYPEAACGDDRLEVHALGPGTPRMQIYTAPLPSGRSGFFTMTITKAMSAGAVFTELTKDQREAFPKIAANEGVLVETVMAGSVAEAAGLKPFDVITRANNEVVASPMELVKIIQGSTLPVSLWVIKGDNQRKVTLPVGR